MSAWLRWRGTAGGGVINGWLLFVYFVAAAD